MHPISKIWKSGSPPSGTFFCWLAGLDKILMVDHLSHCAVIITSFCLLSREDGESVNHLQCKQGRQTWEGIFKLFGLSKDLSGSLIDDVLNG